MDTGRYGGHVVFLTSKILLNGCQKGFILFHFVVVVLGFFSHVLLYISASISNSAAALFCVPKLTAVPGLAAAPEAQLQMCCHMDEETLCCKRFSGAESNHIQLIALISIRDIILWRSGCRDGCWLIHLTIEPCEIQCGLVLWC